MHSPRISLICLMALCLVSGFATAAPQQPNIIFVLADDLGYGDLGCYGQQVIKTPNLDQFAQEGLRFTDAYAGSTVCAPSRCALMTGRHTGHCTVRGNARVPLLAEDLTVAEVLKDAGYTTALIGKWGLGEPDTTGIPNRQGFDYFFGYLNQRHAHTYYPEYLWRNEEKIPLAGNVEEKENVAKERTQYSHDLFTEEALNYLKQDFDKPFFLYLAYTIPHANNERGHAKGDGMEVPDYGIYKDTEWPNPQKGHAAMITRMDRDFGTLMQTLKQQGLDENTLVIFTSDNGTHKEGGADPDFFNSSRPLRGYKRALYDGGIRVPAMARWPGTIKPKTQSAVPWAFWDFLPTAAEIAGIDAPGTTDGLSILPILTGEANTLPQREHLYWEFHEGGFKQAVRKDHWKLVRSGTNAKVELFDVSKDIGEQLDISRNHPDVVKELQQLFTTARTTSQDFRTPDEMKNKK